MADKKADLAGPGIGDYGDLARELPDDYEALLSPMERMKAVFITSEGIFGYNLTDDALTEMVLDDCFESRIEVIYHEGNENLESDLMYCIV